MLVAAGRGQPDEEDDQDGKHDEEEQERPVAGHPLELSGRKGERGHMPATRRRRENATALALSAKARIAIRGTPAAVQAAPPARSVKAPQSPAIVGQQREGADQWRRATDEDEVAAEQDQTESQHRCEAVGLALGARDRDHQCGQSHQGQGQGHDQRQHDQRRPSVRI